MTHPSVEALGEAVADLSEAAPDLTLIDAATLSDYQVRLGEIVLQIAEVAKFHKGLRGDE